MDEAGKAAAGLQVRLRAREEELEDMIGTVSQTCFGLTVNCARCHDHKFDPVPQVDYYRMKAALTGVLPGERPLPDVTPTHQPKNIDIDAQLKRALALVKSEEIKHPLTVPPKPFVKPLLKWTFDGASDDAARTLGGTLRGGARIENGSLVLPDSQAVYRSAPIPISITEKSLEVWLMLNRLDQRGGSAMSLQTLDGVTFDGIVFGERQANRWMAGSNGFARTQDVVSSDEIAADVLPVQLVITYAASGDVTLYRNGKCIGGPYNASNGPQRFDSNAWQAIFGLRHDGSNGYLQGSILEARLYENALTAAEVNDSYQAPPMGTLHEPTMERKTSNKTLTGWNQLNALLEKRAQLRTGATVSNRVYAVTSGKPEKTYLLARGDVNSPKDEVVPGAIGAVGHVSAVFQVPESSPESDRRKALAAWITDRRNPLTARVMVNRIWQWHFGTGLVSTPNDFGNTGKLQAIQSYLIGLQQLFRRIMRLAKHGASRRCTVSY